MDDIVTYLIKVLLFLIVFSAIAFLAFTGTRLLGKKMSKSMRGKVMQVVESINLGLDKQLHLVRIGSRFYSIPSSGKNLGEMKEVELDSETIAKIDEFADKNQNLINYENEFRAVWNKLINTTKIDLRFKAASSKSETSSMTVGSKKPLVYVKSEDSEKSDEFVGSDVFQKNLDRLKKITQDKMN